MSTKNVRVSIADKHEKILKCVLSEQMYIENMRL